MPAMFISNMPCSNIVWFCNNKLLLKSSSSSSFSCSASYTSPCNQNLPTIVRRSGNYKPTTWTFEFIQSLNTQYSGEIYLKQAAELKTQLKMMLENEQERVDQLEFIDDLQKLGISYHFEEEINQILTKIYEQMILKNGLNVTKLGNLYTEALQFRLLRQHRFKVSQEVFNCFKNENGEFKSSLENDTEGLLQLYEASHLLTEGENTLEQAREFATDFLHKHINLHPPGHEMDEYLGLMVRSALELPLHWRAERPYAKWFINAYESRPDKNELVLEFAKLDFNTLQATYQEELKHLSRWWKSVNLSEKLPFARDSLVEPYIWTVGGFFRPQHGYARTICTKVIALLTVIDDVYDVYGTLEELELFTEVIQRWDIEKIHQLPEYMQICFSALNKFINDMANDIFRTQGIIIIPYLRKSWADLCTAYLHEARWYFEGQTPRFQEYMDNAWVSIALPTVLCHAFFAASCPIAKEDPQCLHQDIVRWTAMIIRLADDLGTSLDEMKRGDVPKTIQCYINETGAGEEEAQEHIKFLTREIWKKINTEQVAELPFPQDFVRSMTGLSRMAQYIYQNGDANTTQYPFTKDHFPNLLFEDIA